MMSTLIFVWWRYFINDGWWMWCIIDVVAHHACDGRIALRYMLYRSNINNDDDDDDDDDDDGDDDDGSIHVSIQYTTTTIYSWAE